jgi:hypothetical protein
MLDVGWWLLDVSLRVTPCHLPSSRTTHHAPPSPSGLGCWMSDVGCWMFPFPPLPAACPLYALRITHYALRLPLPWLSSPFRIPHSALALRWLLGGLGVSANTLAPPNQCNSSKHVASMFLGCSLLAPGLPLLSFPRPTPNAPPPPPDYSLQTPEALPRLQHPSIRIWHQKMPAADSSRFGLHPRMAPASTQPAATRLGQLLPQQSRQSDPCQVGLICRRRAPAPSAPDGAT